MPVPGIMMAGTLGHHVLLCLIPAKKAVIATKMMIAMHPHAAMAVGLAGEIAAEVAVLNVLHLDKDGLRAQLQAAMSGIESRHSRKFILDVGKGKIEGESAIAVEPSQPNVYRILGGVVDPETGATSPKLLIFARSISEEIGRALSAGTVVVLD